MAPSSGESRVRLILHASATLRAIRTFRSERSRQIRHHAPTAGTGAPRVECCLPAGRRHGASVPCCLFQGSPRRDADLSAARPSQCPPRSLKKLCSDIRRCKPAKLTFAVLKPAKDRSETSKPTFAGANRRMSSFAGECPTFAKNGLSPQHIHHAFFTILAKNFRPPNCL